MGERILNRVLVLTNVSLLAFIVTPLAPNYAEAPKAAIAVKSRCAELMERGSQKIQVHEPAKDAPMPAPLRTHVAENPGVIASATAAVSNFVEQIHIPDVSALTAKVQVPETAKPVEASTPLLQNSSGETTLSDGIFATIQNAVTNRVIPYVSDLWTSATSQLSQLNLSSPTPPAIEAATVAAPRPGAEVSSIGKALTVPSMKDLTDSVAQTYNDVSTKVFNSLNEVGEAVTTTLDAGKNVIDNALPECGKFCAAIAEKAHDLLGNPASTTSSMLAAEKGIQAADANRRPNPDSSPDSNFGTQSKEVSAPAKAQEVPKDFAPPPPATYAATSTASAPYVASPRVTETSDLRAGSAAIQNSEGSNFDETSTTIGEPLQISSGRVAAKTNSKNLSKDGFELPRSLERNRIRSSSSRLADSRLADSRARLTAPNATGNSSASNFEAPASTGGSEFIARSDSADRGEGPYALEKDGRGSSRGAGDAGSSLINTNSIEAQNSSGASRTWVSGNDPSDLALPGGIQALVGGFDDRSTRLSTFEKATAIMNRWIPVTRLYMLADRMVRNWIDSLRAARIAALSERPSRLSIRSQQDARIAAQVDFLMQPNLMEMKPSPAHERVRIGNVSVGKRALILQTANSASNEDSEQARQQRNAQRAADQPWVPHDTLYRGNHQITAQRYRGRTLIV